MRGKLLAAFLITAALGSGCSDNSSDERLRTALDVQDSQQLTEALVSERVKVLIPVGTPERLVAERFKAVGVGKDSLSSYNLIPSRNIAVVRVEFDPRTFGVVKSQWIITLQLDSSQRLQAVSARRYLTGL